MPSQVEIANMALAHLAVGKSISNIETELSIEAKQARLFLTPAIEFVLKSFSWPFATKTAYLALISTDTSDTSIWTYTYRYPEDCLKVRRIVPDRTLYVPLITRIPMQIGAGDKGTTIMTNDVNARIEYTANIFDPTLYSYMFAITVSYLLASYMAPNLTGGDANGLGEKALRLYSANLAIASSQEFHEQTYESVTAKEISEYTQVRD